MASSATLWQPIGETVAEFRSECSELEHVVQGLFEQLDQLRAELDRKSREVEHERQRVAERERQLVEQRTETSRFAHQFEHQEAKLSETLAEIEELKQLVRRAAEETTHRDAFVESHIEKQVEDLQRERQALQRQLAEAQTELSKHASLARDLAGARKEIADLRAAGGGYVASGEDAEHVSELEQERAALEAELELVRGRAAELYDALAQERRVLAEHRTETNNELKQLRRIVEKQAELLAERVAAPPAMRDIPVDNVDDGPIDTSAASDPVINSVMAQFAKLQKDVAQRRQQRKVK